MANGRLAVGGLVLFVAACGGGGGGDGGGSTPPPQTVAADRVTVTATTLQPTVGSGGTADFVVVITNPSTETATNVHATLGLGSGIVSGGGVSCTASGGATCPANPGTLTVASLPAQGSLRFQVPALVASGSRGSIISYVSVGADNELAGANNTAQLSLQTYAADVTVSGSATANRVARGGAATYTMSVSNAGPDAALDVMLQNVVDAAQTLGTIGCAASGGATCPAPAATMTVPTLPSGATLVFTVATTVSPSATGTIGNTLHASQVGDPVTANNVATATTLVGGLTTVEAQSDFGDYIGQGRSYAYSLVDAQMTFTPAGNQLRVQITGDETWDVTFQLPASATRLQAGTYPNLKRYPFHDPAVGGLSWYGEGRGCNTSTGLRCTIDSAVYLQQRASTSIDLRFEQHCEGGAPRAARADPLGASATRLCATGPGGPAAGQTCGRPARRRYADHWQLRLPAQARAATSSAKARPRTYTQANAVAERRRGRTCHLGAADRRQRELERQLRRP